MVTPFAGKILLCINNTEHLNLVNANINSMSIFIDMPNARLHDESRVSYWAADGCFRKAPRQCTSGLVDVETETRLTRPMKI